MEMNEILYLLEKFESSALSSLEVKLHGDEFKAEKNSKSGSSLKEDKPVNFGAYKPESKTPEKIVETELEETKEEEITGYEITSPMVGTFYSSPKVGEDAYVKVGQQINKGDILCILEAMKIMNEVKSPINGIVKKIGIKDEELADFGRVLFILEEN